MMIFIVLLGCVASIVATTCPSGMAIASNVATKTIPATLPQFLSIVGSFLNSSWYSTLGPISFGADNQVGTIRTTVDFTNNSRLYNETLMIYNLNSTYFEQIWKGPGNEGVFIPLGDFNLGSYVEYLNGQSTCGGSAVIVNFGSDSCVTNVTLAVPALTANHMWGIEQVQSLLKIGNFTKCSAVANSMKFNSLFIYISFGIIFKFYVRI
ncbi:unnamed protein product [Adineta ricciae]|uniref:Uncharacterized protein n=1 Tax=Adineta ricciae TaxID=249248 RepID=A0A815V7P9_ADIRI|nr:unnamed protein product [Adineta ricciae]CAF1643353.1 unnamed protein product [Adineta ricciae]